jgi:hypothetical protein
MVSDGYLARPTGGGRGGGVSVSGLAGRLNILYGSHLGLLLNIYGSLKCSEFGTIRESQIHFMSNILFPGAGVGVVTLYNC